MDGEVAQWVYSSGDLSLIPETHMVEEETLTPDSRSPLTSMQTLAGVQGCIHTQENRSFFFFRKKKLQLT